MKPVAMTFDDDVYADEPYTLGDLIGAAVLAVDEDTTISEVQRLLATERVPAIAVVDEAHALRGVITRTDALRALADAHVRCARDAMSRFVLALRPSAAIEKAAALMAYEGVGHIAVTGAGGELLGLVSALDVARHYAIEAGYLVE
jgi:CBS domain-containing protein